MSKFLHDDSTTADITLLFSNISTFSSKTAVLKMVERHSSILILFTYRCRDISLISFKFFLAINNNALFSALLEKSSNRQ